MYFQVATTGTLYSGTLRYAYYNSIGELNLVSHTLDLSTFSGQSKMGIFNFTRTLNLFCNNCKYFKAEFYYRVQPAYWSAVTTARNAQRWVHSDQKLNHDS